MPVLPVVPYHRTIVSHIVSFISFSCNPDYKVIYCNVNSNFKDTFTHQSLYTGIYGRVLTCITLTQFKLCYLSTRTGILWAHNGLYIHRDRIRISHSDGVRQAAPCDGRSGRVHGVMHALALPRPQDPRGNGWCELWPSMSQRHVQVSITQYSMLNILKTLYNVVGKYIDILPIQQYTDAISV